MTWQTATTLLQNQICSYRSGTTVNFTFLFTLNGTISTYLPFLCRQYSIFCRLWRFYFPRLRFACSILRATQLSNELLEQGCICTSTCRYPWRSYELGSRKGSYKTIRTGVSTGGSDILNEFDSPIDLDRSRTVC